MRAGYIRGLLCAVVLAGCFGAQAGQLADDPDAPWVPGLPIANSFAGIVNLDSDPSGAEATTSLGGGCRTPCSLEVSADGPFTVTFTHEGYASATVQVKIQHARMGVSERQFTPNPVSAQLAPVAEPAPPQPAPKKTVATPRPPQPAPKKTIATPRPPHAAPKAPVAAAQPAAQPAPAQPAPAQPAWPAEVKPIAGINSGRIVPADAARSRDDAVARRWLENFDKPAPDH